MLCEQFANTNTNDDDDDDNSVSVTALVGSVCF
jgi:hypothetical protein